MSEAWADQHCSEKGYKGLIGTSFRDPRPLCWLVLGVGLISGPQRDAGRVFVGSGEVLRG